MDSRRSGAEGVIGASKGLPVDHSAQVERMRYNVIYIIYIKYNTCDPQTRDHADGSTCRGTKCIKHVHDFY